MNAESRFPFFCLEHGRPIRRRAFLKTTGITAAGLAWTRFPAVAGPFTANDFAELVPRDKKLSAAWIDSLTARGQPEVFRGPELRHIGMPVGGIACGQLYLGGDGQLWYWDIFKSVTTSDYAGKIWAGPRYAQPATPDSVIEQGFAIRVQDGTSSVTRPLNQDGFAEVSFRGEYPDSRRKQKLLP